MGAVVAPDTSKPVPVTMLWPLADRPRLAPGVPGGTIPVRLIDDELATSLATGGRLDVLLSAAEFATSHDVDPDGAVGRALCLAVDPDLLVTVNAMTGRLRRLQLPRRRRASSPAPRPTRAPGRPRRPTWLNRLRALAHRMCVAPLPYAQADLDALQRVGDPGLSATATNGAGDVVDQILGVASVRGATLIPDGPLTRRGGRPAQRQRQHGGDRRRRLLRRRLHQRRYRRPSDTAPRRLSPQVVIAPFDPAVGAALAATGTDPVRRPIWTPR